MSLRYRIMKRPAYVIWRFGRWIQDFSDWLEFGQWPVKRLCSCGACEK